MWVETMLILKLFQRAPWESLLPRASASLGQLATQEVERPAVSPLPGAPLLLAWKVLGPF